MDRQTDIAIANIVLALQLDPLMHLARVHKRHTDTHTNTHTCTHTHHRISQTVTTFS